MGTLDLRGNSQIPGTLRLGIADWSAAWTEEQSYLHHHVELPIGLLLETGPGLSIVYNVLTHASQGILQSTACL